VVVELVGVVAVTVVLVGVVFVVVLVVGGTNKHSAAPRAMQSAMSARLHEALL
jgi:hypothetical protein